MLPDSDNDFGAGADCALRQRCADAEINVIRINIGQFAGIDVEEVMMWFGPGIVELTNRIDIHSPQQTAFTEQLESIVNRCLRHARIDSVQAAQDLVGRQMPGTIENERGDFDALSCWLDAVELQQTHNLLFFHAPSIPSPAQKVAAMSR